jgi:hypothetical protein
MYRVVLVSIIILWSNGLLFSQQVDYKAIFGKDWDKAESFVTENEFWMKQLSEKYDVSYAEAVAIVFPELIRYSALRDKMEITLLKSLYIYKGEDYADFSIGQFQMKPSFAEDIHQNIKLLRGQIRNQFRAIMNIKDITKYRTSLVKDLEQPESQFLYLIAFMKICETTYDLNDMGEIQRIKFLATAYNYSFQRSFEEVKGMIGKKFFYAKLIKTESYPYSDISVYWHNNYQKKIKKKPVLSQNMFTGEKPDLKSFA